MLDGSSCFYMTESTSLRKTDRRKRDFWFLSFSSCLNLKRVFWKILWKEPSFFCQISKVLVKRYYITEFNFRKTTQWEITKLKKNEKTPLFGGRFWEMKERKNVEFSALVKCGKRYLDSEKLRYRKSSLLELAISFQQCLQSSR